MKSLIKKTCLLFAYPLLFWSVATAQNTYLKTSGRQLLNLNNDTVVLRGLNAGIAEDGTIDVSDTTQTYPYIDEIAKTGANAIRFTWYTDGVSWRDGGTYCNSCSTNPEPRYHKGSGMVMHNYIANGGLHKLFSYCKKKGMIPVWAIHDLTCSDDWTYFNNDLKNWWTSPLVVNFINAHQDNLIINIANEFGSVTWAGNPVTASANMQANYSAFIQSLRALNVKVPVMIDAPDCGQSSGELLAMSNALLASDPLHNTVFSAHGYWASYAPNASAVQARLNAVVSNQVCFVLGEVANSQAGPPNYCGEIDLSMLYPIILQEACLRKIGWLAWSWDQDCDPQRMISSNGLFNNLTPYGNDIVNNTTYGLKSTGTCGNVITTSVASFTEHQSLNTTIFPMPNHGTFFIESDYLIYKVQALDILGKEVELEKISTNGYAFRSQARGIYLIKISGGSERPVLKKLIIE